ncbi:retrotransposon hot spot (RHS) protein [Trypanosoma cruzi]|nr:retrotransposon hot spot (RHS) protein [Trypanosoma cruzi]
MSARDFLLLVLGKRDNFFSASLEKYALNAFLNLGFVSALVEDLKELQPPPSSKPRSSVPTLNPHGYPTEAAAITELELVDCPQDLKYWLPYLPAGIGFPLVDFFFICEVKSEDAGWAADGYGGWAPHQSQHCEAVH